MIAGLPYDAEVEYLESADGFQYIDTGITGAMLHDNGGLIVSCMPITLGQYTPSANISNDHDLNFLGLNASSKNIYFRLADAFTSYSASHFGLDDFIGNRMTFEAVNKKWNLYINGYIDSGEYINLCKETNNHLCIFYGGSYGGSYGWNGRFRIYEAKCFYDSSKIAFDFIPVRFTNELGQSEGAMYDRVTKRLFRNRGTGSFLYGPDVSIPLIGLWGHNKPITARSYVQNGLIAMWDGIENAGWGVHDANATVWKDLVGTRDATLSGSFSWGAKYWDVQSVSGRGIATWDGTILPDSQTWEIVIHPSASIGYGRIIAEGMNIASPVVRPNSDSVYMYGYGMDAGWQVPDLNNKEIHLHTIVHPSNGTMDYHIDGASVWTRSTNNDSTGNTYGYFANRGSDYGRGIDAKYYSVRLYSRALTAAEIAANYAIDRMRFGLK